MRENRICEVPTYWFQTNCICEFVVNMVQIKNRFSNVEKYVPLLKLEMRNFDLAVLGNKNSIFSDLMMEIFKSGEFG